MISLDQSNAEGYTLIDVLAGNEFVESEAYKSILIEQIMHEINQLSDEEKETILRLLLEEKTVHQMSK